MYYHKDEFQQYILITFIISWILEICAGVSFLRGGTVFYQILLMIVFFVPTFAVMSIGKIKQVDWTVGFKKNWKLYLFSWLLPGILTAIGALVYFVIFPDNFDSECGYLALQYAEVLSEDGTAGGTSLSSLALLSIVACFTYAPLINGLVAVGEEVGWTSYLTTVLKDEYGKNKGLIYSALIRGLWYAPLVILVGYEYGYGYFGFPLTGIIMFIVVAMGLNVILSWLYEKSESILVPSIFHGAFYAASSVPLCFTTGELTSYILGPNSNGLIAFIPFIVVAIIIWKKGK